MVRGMHAHSYELRSMPRSNFFRMVHVSLLTCIAAAIRKVLVNTAAMQKFCAARRQALSSSTVGQCEEI